MSTTTTSTTSTTLLLPAHQLAEAFRFVAPAMGDAHDALHGVFVIPGPVWFGISGSTPQWGPQDGITLVTTDRFRLHIVGIETDQPTGLTKPAFLHGQSVTNALKAAPRRLKRYDPNILAELTFAATGGALIGWPGTTVSVDVDRDRNMPGFTQVLTSALASTDPLAESIGINPTFLAETAAVFKNDTRTPMRMRVPHGSKPMIFDTHDVEDSRTVVLMPVRLPS